ncbi:MAG: sulfite exporter TauE/SafE family protein [Gemmatimonadota bacterium]|nr:sulfite exporter TauE/SafE family protein [Gemmatimonadota bacterium]
MSLRPVVTMCCAAIVLSAGTSHAHPMGNVSISHYAGIDISPDTTRVKYLLDFAEVPSVRELARIDTDLDDRVTPEERDAYLSELTGEVLPRLSLEVNGQHRILSPLWSRVVFPPGQGGLSTVRVTWELEAIMESPGEEETHLLVWADSNYPDHMGWKEIRISASDGLQVAKTSLRANLPTSGGLTEYPEEYLFDPPTDTSAWCVFGPGLTAENADLIELPAEFAAPRPEGGRFVNLVSGGDLSARAVLVSLLLAMLLGAGHSLEPGHGKALVAAYLVGSRGTVAQAVLLGIIVTVTHTLVVFVLGFAVLLLSQHFVPELLIPWLGVASGLLVTLVGATMLRSRIREFRGHSHQHSHDHTHDPPTGASPREILALGISGGLVPCPAGIVVLLAAVSLGRTSFGLLLITAFSIGMAAILSAVGILFVTARRLFDRAPLDSKVLRGFAAASSVAVMVFGIVLAWRALAETGLL